MSRYKLIDFGISTPASSGDHNILRTLVGTPKYMAPELLESFLTEKSRVIYNPYKSDCYSLGLIMLEISTDSSEEISGINRPNDDPDEKLNKCLNKFLLAYGDQLLSLVKRMLDRSPEKRPDYKEILSIIDRLLKSFSLSNISVELPIGINLGITFPDVLPLVLIIE